jgi:PKD repeat protein
MTEARWTYGDGVTEVLTDTETSHSYSSRGNYPVTCEVFRTNVQGQRVLAGYVSTVIHAGYEGVESYDDAKGCSLYPNPANSIVTIEGQNITAVRLTNCIGQVVMEKACVSVESMTLDLTELPIGIYIIEVVASSYRTIKQLVISR